MNNEDNIHRHAPHSESNPQNANQNMHVIDWEFYRRFLYEIWEEKSLESVSDCQSLSENISSESLELPFALNCPANVFYSAKRNRFYPTSCSAKNPGQAPFLGPRPTEGMAQEHFQGDTEQEKKSTERSEVAATHYGDAKLFSERCTQCNEQQRVVIPASRGVSQSARLSNPFPPSIDVKKEHFNYNNGFGSGYNVHVMHPRSSSQEERGKNLSKTDPLLSHQGSVGFRGIPQIPAGDGGRKRCDVDERVKISPERNPHENLFTVLDANETRSKKEAFEPKCQNKSCNNKWEETSKNKPTASSESDALSDRITFPGNSRGYQENSKQAAEMCLCGEEIKRLRRELLDSRNQISALSMQMEDQSSHLQNLIEDRRRSQQRKPCRKKNQNPNYSQLSQAGIYKFSSADLLMRPQEDNVENRGGLFSYDSHTIHDNSSSRPLTEDYLPYSLSECGPSSPHGGDGALGGGDNPEAPYKRERAFQELTPPFPEEVIRDPNVLAALKERFLALQMQNIHLNLFLRKEEERRQEVEANLEKERNYIKKLEDNIQSMRSSRVVMDPLTYKDVADNYIAARKQPVRRTHTCVPCIGKSDLVCDLKTQDTLSIHYPHSNNSCPSSPRGLKNSNKMTGSFHQQQQMGPPEQEAGLAFDSESTDGERETLFSWSNESASNLSFNSLDQDEYLKLLNSLEKLNTKSPS